MILYQKMERIKKLIFISLLAIFASCSSKSGEQKIVYYPSEKEFLNPDFLVPIDLDTTSLKYWDLAMMTPANDYRKNIPYFEIKSDSVTKRIVPFLIDSPFVNRNEVIKVTMDSIYADKKYGIDEMDKVLKNIFGKQNKAEFLNYRRNPNFIRLAIDIDTNSTGKDLKKVLLRTTDTFEKVKTELSDSLMLIIYFDTLFGLYGTEWTE